MDTDTQPFTSQEKATESPKNPPLWKQLMGAGVGMTLALSLYYGYKSAAPVVTAYLVPPGGVTDAMLQGETAASEKTLTQEEGTLRRIGSRTRELAQKMLLNRPAEEPAAETMPEETAAAPVAPRHRDAPVMDTTPPPAPAWAPAGEATLALASLRPGAPAWEPMDKGVWEKGPIDKGPVPMPPEVPQSGPALWVAGLGALFGAYGMRRRLQVS